MIKSLFGGESVSEVELPEWMGLILHSEDDLLKGAGHKYIRRVPTGNPKKPWKYFYKVSGGSGLGHHSEFIEGAAFKVAHNGKEGHFHILGVDGDKLRIKHDESGEESTLTKDALTSLLHKEHAQAIGVHKERLKKELVAVAKHGTAKQKEKIKAEAEKAGVVEERPLWLQTQDEATSAQRDELYRRKNMGVNDTHGLRGGGGKRGSGKDQGGFSKQAWASLKAAQNNNSPIAALDQIQDRREQHQAAVRDALARGDLTQEQYQRMHAATYGPLDLLPAFRTRSEVAAAAQEQRDAADARRTAYKEALKNDKATRSAAHAVKIASTPERRAGDAGTTDTLTRKHLSSASVGSVIYTPDGRLLVRRTPKGWITSDGIKEPISSLQLVIDRMTEMESKFGSGRPIKIVHGGGPDLQKHG